MTWLAWVALIGALLALFVEGLTAFGSMRWTDATRTLTARLEAGRLPTSPGRYDPRELECLPAPVNQPASVLRKAHVFLPHRLNACRLSGASPEAAADHALTQTARTVTAQIDARSCWHALAQPASDYLFDPPDDRPALIAAGGGVIVGALSCQRRLVFLSLTLSAASHPRSRSLAR